jgi:hypothetical protein
MDELIAAKKSIDKAIRYQNHQANLIEQHQRDIKEMSKIIKDMFDHSKFKKSNVYQLLYNKYYVRFEAIVQESDLSKTDKNEAMIPGLYEDPNMRKILPFDKNKVISQQKEQKKAAAEQDIYKSKSHVSSKRQTLLSSVDPEIWNKNGETLDDKVDLDSSNIKSETPTKIKKSQFKKDLKSKPRSNTDYDDEPFIKFNGSML